MAQIFIASFFSSLIFLFAGKVCSKILRIDKFNLRYIDLILLALFLIGFLSITINFFLPLDYLTNSLTYAFISIIYFYYYKFSELLSFLKFSFFISFFVYYYYSKLTHLTLMLTFIIYPIQIF